MLKTRMEINGIRIGRTLAAETYERVYQEAVKFGRPNPQELAIQAAVVSLGFKMEDAKPLTPPDPESSYVQ